MTDAGRAELFDWLRELLAQPRHEYPQFGVALSLLSIVPPADAIELLERRASALEEEARGIRETIETTTQAGVPWVFVTEEEYRLAVVEAERGYVQRLVESLGQPDYAAAWTKAFEQAGR